VWPAESVPTGATIDTSSAAFAYGHMKIKSMRVRNGASLTIQAGGTVSMAGATLAQLLGAIPIGYVNYYLFRSGKVEAAKAAPRTRAQVIMDIEKEVLEEAADPETLHKPKGLETFGRIATPVAGDAALVVDTEAQMVIVNIFAANEKQDFLHCDLRLVWPCAHVATAWTFLVTRESIPLVASKQQAILFDMGLPDSLEEAIVLFYALAFGPIPNSVIAKALTQAGMTMPNGDNITLQKIVPYIHDLEKEQLLVTSDRDNAEQLSDTLDEILKAL